MIESIMENIEETKKTYWLVKLSAISLICVPFAVLAVIVFCHLHVKISTLGGYLLGVFIFSFLVASFLLAIISLIKIYRSNQTLGGKKIAVRLIIISSIILAFMVPVSLSFYMRCYADRMMCSTNLCGFGKAILTYANDHNDNLPDANWCDELTLYYDCTPDQFVCPDSDAKVGESCYALNKEVIGKKLGYLPQNMILIFETNQGRGKYLREFDIKGRAFYNMGRYKGKVYKDRWNQVGGPELLTAENHNGDGANFLFADLHCKFEKGPDYSSLKWKLHEKPTVIFPLGYKPKFRLPLTKISYLATVCIIVLLPAFFLVLKHRMNLSKSILLKSIIAGFAGSVFAFHSQFLFHHHHHHFLALLFGFVFGFLTVLCYLLIIAGTPQQFQHENFKKYTVSVGMLAGVIFAIIVQTLLMIVCADMRHEGPNPFAILAAMPFGLLAGMLLGKAAVQTKTDLIITDQHHSSQ